MTQAAENDASSLTAGLEVLDRPQKITVETTQGSFIVDAVRMHSFKKFATLAWPLVQDAMALIDGKGNIGAFVEAHGDSVCQILVLSSTLTNDKYEQFYMDDTLKMVLAVIEVNMDFFVQNLIPMIGERAQGIKAKIEASVKRLGLKASNA